MVRYFVAPDDSGFHAVDGDPALLGVPAGWSEVDAAEFASRREAANEQAQQHGQVLLDEDRQRRISAAQALEGLGLAPEDAALLAGVWDDESSPGESSPGDVV